MRGCNGEDDEILLGENCAERWMMDWIGEYQKLDGRVGLSMDHPTSSHGDSSRRLSEKL